MGRLRVTVDTGGTFSDFVVYYEEERRLEIFKVPSTPEDPSRAILAGVERLVADGVDPGDIVFFLHGTTVGTNALLEGKGARAGMLVTDGFLGVMEVGEQCREYGPGIFDLFFEKPRLLIPASRTIQALERLSSTGEVLVPLDIEALGQEIDKLADAGIESVAVCFLFSFLNPTHERAAAQIIRAKLPGVNLSLSSEVLSQIREYYRFSTTVINAYLAPVMTRYLSKLGGRLREKGLITHKCYAMQSNGGVTTFARAGEHAITTILSGPAGGAVAGAKLGISTSRDNLITFDMGGTSCDVALIREGRPLVTTQGRVAGRHIGLPMLDIHTVSAGGGTLAWVDRVGVLQVGPQSAGAVPGPVCYGVGGEIPTVTDANLVLGYLNPKNFLGGGMALDRDKARAAIDERLAKPLGLTVERAAEGVLRIVNVTMEEAIKSMSTRRGYDLRDFTLVAFGGAGPLHAAGMAKDLGIPEVLIPTWPGVTSALGLLMSEVRHDHVRSRVDLLANLAVGDLLSVWQELEREASEQMREEGFQPGEWRYEHYLDLRYAGQGYELSVPVSIDLLERQGTVWLRDYFDQQHQLRHGHSAPQQPVEVINYRMVAYGKLEPIELPRVQEATYPVETAMRGQRSIYFGVWQEYRPCAIYDRSLLQAGHRVVGPAIIEQYDSTTVVEPGQEAIVDEWGNLLLSIVGD